MTTQAGAPAGAPALATATEATAAEVEGPEATRAAPPGPPAPVTTAGAAQKVVASEPIQTPIGAPWHRERRGLRPQDPWGAYREVPGPGKTLRVGDLQTRRSLVLLLLKGPYPHLLPSHHVQGTKSLFEHRDHPAPTSCLMPAHQAWGSQLSGPRDISEGANPGSLPYPLCGALGSSRSLGRQGEGTASRIKVRQKEEWPNPWCATIQDGELLSPELAAGGPWLRAGGWPHSLPNPSPGPGVPGRARELTLGPTFSSRPVSPLQASPHPLVQGRTSQA